MKLKRQMTPGSKERRAEIVEATQRILNREGVQGASLRAIARELGLTTGSVTHHFRDKEELLCAAVDATFGPFDVLLATDAASEGLNLHRRCRLVINLELPWTPVRLEQRIGRVERIGQTRRVHAVHLLASGTSEEQAVARLLIRARHAARALSEITPLDDSETAIADAVIGGIPPAPRSAGVPFHHGPAPDLHAAAQQEAGRLELTPWLASDSETLPSDPRPCETELRRNGIRRSYWLYRLPWVDRELQVAWEALTAFTADVRSYASCWRVIGTWLATPTGAKATECATPGPTRSTPFASTTATSSGSPHSTS